MVSVTDRDKLPSRGLAWCLVAPKQVTFDPDTFLSTIGEGRKALHFVKKQTVFAQGDATDAVFYIQKGKIKLTVISSNGKEATIGILGEGDFFGEGCLAGQRLRMGSASAVTNCDSSANR